MSARFEAVALKKLQEIIQEKGISAEAIFSKFDINNDGSLDPDEFRRAIASITGQNAPDAIIRAVFTALDSDGDNSLDLAELLALAGGGQAGAITGEINEISIQGTYHSRIQRRLSSWGGYQWSTKFFKTLGSYSVLLQYVSRRR